MRSVLLHPIPKKRSVIHLIVFNAIPRDEKRLHILILAVEIGKLIEGWMFGQQFSHIITVFFFEHHSICSFQAVFILCIIEFVDCPPEYLFICCQFPFLTLLWCKNGYILISKFVCIYSLFLQALKSTRFSVFYSEQMVILLQ